jgi:hypothetical protein
MTRLIRELIEIPERVHKGEFVLRLSEGIERPAETLGSYVVTDPLRNNFQQALDLIRRALEGRRSAGAYLHGSFGSGKSHFMAVLHLLLQHNPEARSIPALAPVVANMGWAEGKKFLLVPYHLMGADSLEQAVLGHYVEHVRKLHPEAPLPAVYLAEALFENAEGLRAQMGDETFFRQLNRGKTASSGWGKLAADGWNAESLAAAQAASPTDPRRLSLVSDLVVQLFPAYRGIAAGGAAGFVSLDIGLSVISRHAQSLGYEGLVLFLDELILWLASHVADLSFITHEGSKVAKLVESETADRPVPIISFIARQRDLRELVGDHLPGAERLSFSDTLKWSEGRFDTITLDDRNLPAIAKQRLLQPRNEEARQEMDRAFTESQKVRAEVLETLLGRDGNPESFRDVYPFSPALVQALVAISSVLQRERTALRVMLQLLVDQRDTLKLGDLVPVGDLFDVIADGDEPFTEAMRVHFDRAKRLYHQKLLPMLQRRHGLNREEARALPYDDPRATAFRGDDRLVKTLLLAALAPEVETFRGLTASRLAALNHGSIRSPIPGGEAKMVITRIRDWAAQAGEIKLAGDPANQTIALQLAGVDTESILEKARIQDNVGNRKQALKTLLFQELGLPVDDHLFLTHSFVWRGTARQVDVVFANIREQAFDALRAKGEEWKIIIDFPFDAEGHTAKSDLAKLEDFRDQEPDTATFCWVPAFFSHEAQRDLGTYVILDYLLLGAERFNDHAAHLSQVDRATARAVLENQHSQLRQHMVNCLAAAYGVAKDSSGLVDGSLELADRFRSLDKGFRPQPPAAASLRQALEQILDQIFTYRFPRHPRFETRITAKELRKVWDVASQATRAPQGRVEVEKELRQTVRQIANPLDLGEMHEAAFVLNDTWRNHLTRGAAAAGTVTVGKLRAAFDQPEARGLPRDVQDLLILVFAEQTNRSFFRYNAPQKGDLGQLQDDYELREQKLPSGSVWDAARDLASRIFGFTVPSFLAASTVSALRQSLDEAFKPLRKPCSDLVETVRSWSGTFGLESGPEGTQTPRLRTALAMQTVVEELSAAPADRALETLAEATLATSAEAMARSWRTAEEIVRSLRSAPVSLLTSLVQIEDERRPRAEAILAGLREALSRDELAVDLQGAVQKAVAEAAGLLATRAQVVPPGPHPPGPPLPSPPLPPEEAGRRWREIQGETCADLDAAAAAALFRRIEEMMQRGPDERRLRVTWSLEERAAEGSDER